MNKGELIDAVARNTGESKATAAKVIDETLDVIVSGVVTQGKVQITGFGTFEARDRKARIARNPQTGAEVTGRGNPCAGFQGGQGVQGSSQARLIYETKPNNGEGAPSAPLLPWVSAREDCVLAVDPLGKWEVASR